MIVLAWNVIVVTDLTVTIVTMKEVTSTADAVTSDSNRSDIDICRPSTRGSAPRT